ncbi:MAG: glycosyltransferase family 4 protein, partial [Actinomycetota bacterium]|nr:glycosyltransferase family 4 protein [Actinomycetota bacterium]
GHMSNLCHTKGLVEVVAVYRRLRSEHPMTHLSLAGPTQCATASALLTSLADDPHVSWVGAIDGPTKDEFLRSVDVFLFPSRYKIEAEPLVVWEAASAGCPVIATTRGCLGQQVTAAHGWTFSEERFVDEAVSLIESLLAEPGGLAAAQTECARAAKDAKAYAERQLASLLRDLAQQR